MTVLRTAFTSAALLAGGLFGMTPDDAAAQIRFQIGSGNGGYGYGGYGYGNSTRGNATYYNGSGVRSSNYGAYGSRYSGYSGGQRYSGTQRYNSSRWHDTSHYDYHPTTVVPHGNHYHVVPGHYDYHQSGHWH